MLRRIHISVNANAGKLVSAKASFLTAAPPPSVAAPAASSTSAIRCLRSTAAPLAASPRALLTARRTFLKSLLRRKVSRVKVDNVTFDKETTRYRGTIFGLPADDVVFYGKVAVGTVVVLAVFYTFFKGYVILSRFSMQTVARLGFTGGFISCMIIYTTAVQLVRRANINANAVYNQSISLVMRNDKVQQFLGSHPRTGEFKSYNATGGLKLPLLRRIRSGTYELSDMLGLKQRRLQMLFVLKNPVTGHEGVVACDVRRETSGFLASTNVYKSLSITLSDSNAKSAPETIILIGKPEDVVYKSLLK